MQFENFSSTGNLMKEKILDCELGGYSYHLKIDGEPEKAQKVIDYVNDKICSLKRGTEHLNKDDVLLLTSLLLAEEVLSFKNRAHFQLDRLESEVQRVSSELKKSQIALKNLSDH